MKLLSVVAITAMLGLTGCMENAERINQTNMQQAVKPKEISMDSPAHHAGKLPILTQASSTATAGIPQSMVSMSQAPYAPSWCSEMQPPSGSPVIPTNPIQTPIQPMNPDNEAAPPAQQETAAVQLEDKVLQLVNKHRASAGLSALAMDNNLAKMALVKAQDMYDNNYFDHNSPTYGSPFDMMNKFQISYSSAGENIAKGQTSAEQVMNDWMNSPGHRANILNSGFTKIGIGHYNGAWVQEFIS